jgi:pimeloyl-ACP methyl ester carboxylesterase
MSTFPYMIFGNEKSDEDVVMLAGFPDDQTSGWGAVLANLMSLGTCRIICLCFPDHEKDATPKPWGYSCEEVLAMLNNTIDLLIPDKSKKVNFVMHDWGSFYGLVYENRFPQRVKKLVALDVGVISSIRSPPVMDLVKILLYQWWFAGSYLVSQAINFNLGNYLFKLFFRITPSCLHPWPHDKIFHRKDQEVTVSVCYLYYHFWRKYILSLSLRPFEAKYPTSPTYFIWGRMKGLMYHEAGFLTHLRSLAHCKCLEIETSGHWLQHSSPETVTSEIVSFLHLDRS